MLIKRSLWIWYSRRAWPVTWIALLVVVFHVLIVRREPYRSVELEPWIFLTLHCMALNWRVNSLGGPDCAFLYTRGFTRDTLWSHRILVTLAHAFTVWGVAATLIWTGLRSAFQSSYLHNPEFPLMDGLDAGLPSGWLLGYLITLSALQYASIRRWQPTLGASSGYWLVLGLLALPEIVVRAARSNSIGPIPIIGGLLAVTLTLLFVARWLHRDIEVQA